MLRREACRYDKRGSIAALTDAGFAVLERAAPGHVETVRSFVFDRLSEEQVAQLEEISAAIAQGLQEDGTRSASDDVPWRRRSSPACS